LGNLLNLHGKAILTAGDDMAPFTAKSAVGKKRGP